MTTASGWIEAATAVLLVASGLASLVAATGLVRLPTIFLRMHPPALASTFGVWAVAAASTLHFSMLEGMPVLNTWAIPAVLAITMPLTSMLLARAALFRKRQAGANMPPSLRPGDGPVPPRSDA
ncbi:MAG: Na+/H+ antiporter subunit G [Betaproteobacteria bacterium]